jgi:hypothetical protein
LVVKGKGCVNLEWIQLVQWRSVMKNVINFRAEKFFTSWVTISFLRRALFNWISRHLRVLGWINQTVYIYYW